MVRFMAENKSIETWLAPLGPLHAAVPIYIGMETLLGLLVIEANEIHVSEGAKAAQR